MEAMSVEGFGLQTKILDLHIGSEILCVRGSEVWELVVQPSQN